MGWRSRLRRHVEDEVRPSIEKRVEAGTVLFRAGDPALAAALILDGEIELLAEAADGGGRVGRRGRGAYVGDDEILGDGVWHRTARVLRQTRLEMLPRDVFLERVAGRQAAAMPAVAAVYTVRLQAASPESATLFPAAAIEVVEFPFTVGRLAPEPPEPAASRALLALAEPPPYRLSRRQFTILRTAEGAAIVDSGSRLGTFMAGRRVDAEPVPLPSGETVEITAGGPHSPLRFRLSAD